jgi:hypothetical protein
MAVLERKGTRMHRSHSSIGRLGTAVLSTLVVTSFVIAAPASAATSGVVTVTGGSVSTIDLTIPDASAAFGANLTPDGAGGSGEVSGVNVDTTVPSAGACFEWSGSSVVKSNVSYGLSLSATAANNRLDLLTVNPADYAACTSGTQVSTSATTWVTGQAVTSSRTHAFWLGLNVLWTDAPNANLANATLTLTAVAGL